MIKNFFFFTKGEKTGLIILFLLIGIVFAVNASFNYIMPSEATLLSDYEKEINQFKLDLAQKPDDNQRQKKTPDNTILSRTTFSDKKKDLPNKEKSFILIEINSTDTTELKRLKGIGSVYSRRIIKYRNYLGGFHSIEQLKEVYGINEDLFFSIKKNLTVDASKIRRFNINCDSFCYKFRHPYLGKEEVKHLLQMKRDGEKIKREDIKNILSLSEEKWKKLRPYISE